MSKQGKRKITVELPKSKDLANRPSVFDRLGIKKSSSVKKTTEHCRQWAQHGSCAYGKSCKFAATHTLISPSKQRATNKESEQKRIIKDDGKNRLHSTVVVRTGRSPDGEIDNWDQNDLEYADTDVLEKRRQQLQRELELQMKMDSSKDMRKDKKKAVSSTSSSRSSSSSSVSSSSSDGSSSSSSSERDARRKNKKGKLKRNSSSSSDGEVPTKKKYTKSDAVKREKSEVRKGNVKKDDRLIKKHDNTKKKSITKTSIGKKSLSPGKKSGGTPPITSKSLVKTTSKHSKSPQRRDRNRSASPHSVRDRDKDKDRNKDKEREKEKDKDRDKERNRAKSRTPRKGRSRSPRHLKDPRKKESSERSRPVSPKKQARRDGSSDRHRKRSSSRDRDRGRDHKDRSLERRKDKHDDKDRHERKDRGRDRKDIKRDDSKRRGRDRGLGGRSGSDKGLEKPNKPMERLLPRPEERLAALAAISNRTLETDKNSSTSKDRQDTHSERGSRKQERHERERSSKRDRMESLDREQGDYEIGMDRQYDNDHSIDHYDRVDDRYEGVPRDDDRSPGYGVQGRERHYETGYDMPGPSRGYPDEDDRMYSEHMGDHRGVDMGYDDRRPHRDHSWERRSGSLDRDRAYMHRKEWENEDYRNAGEWGRERHWSVHESQMNEWGDKDPEMDGWHHRGHGNPHRGRMHVTDDYGRGVRMDMNRGEGKRRGRNELDQSAKETPPPAQAAPIPTRQDIDIDDKPIPDDLSEISDDPDDILNREDMVDQNVDDDSQNAERQNVEEGASKPDGSEKESTQDTSGAGEEKESQDLKDEEDVTNLDFEEISDGELEEERTRAGLGDALGVDWASLVADVRRREQTTSSGGARDRWRPERVLARLGLSIHMAGKEVVESIILKNAESLNEETCQEKKLDNSDKNNTADHNGKHENETIKAKIDVSQDVNSLHPVASIQVAMQKRKRQRAVLFGSGCEITRGLSARRDLALRRYLCHLPASERTGQSRVTPQSSLFHAAQALLMQAPVSG